MSNNRRTAFDQARDELFSQINRCGVLRSTPEQQQEWLRDTQSYLEETFAELSESDARELREQGERFWQPAIPHGKANTELTRERWEEDAPAGAETASV